MVGCQSSILVLIRCISYGDSIHSNLLKYREKFYYMGHRRWLEVDHPFRFQQDVFDCTIKLQSTSIPPSEIEVLIQMYDMNHRYGSSMSEG